MSSAQTHVVAPGATTDRPWPRWRVLLIRIWAGLLTLQMLMMAQGVLHVGGVDDGQQFVAATSTVFKLLSLGGAAWVMWSGGRSVSAYWMILVGQVVWAFSGVLAPQPDANPPLLDLVNVAIFYGPLVALRPRRRELLHPDLRPHALSTSVAAVGAVGLIAHAWTFSREALHDELAFDAVGLYLTLALMTLFAATRPAGARWLVPSVVTGALVVGAVALAFPGDVASPGVVGAALIAAWAIAFAVSARRLP